MSDYRLKQQMKMIPSHLEYYCPEIQRWVNRAHMNSIYFHPTMIGFIVVEHIDSGLSDSEEREEVYWTVQHVYKFTEIRKSR